MCGTFHTILGLMLSFSSQKWFQSGVDNFWLIHHFWWGKLVEFFYSNISKTVDTVSHIVRLETFETLNHAGNMLYWIEIFLSNRCFSLSSLIKAHIWCLSKSSSGSTFDPILEWPSLVFKRLLSNVHRWYRSLVLGNIAVQPRPYFVGL